MHTLSTLTLIASLQYHNLYFVTDEETIEYIDVHKKLPRMRPFLFYSTYITAFTCKIIYILLYDHCI